MRQFLLFAMAACMVSCERMSVLDSAVEGEEYVRKFTFMVKGDFAAPTFSDARRRAYMTADGVEMTDLWVVDMVGGEVKQQLHQTPSDADWGTPQMSLALGTHHIMFLASRGQNPTYEDGVVTWSKALDTFYKDYEVTVIKTSNGNRAVTLDRCATRMSLVVEDAIPAGTTSIIMKPVKWYDGWDMLTGMPIEGEYEVAFTGMKSGVKGLTLSMWGMSDSKEWVTDVAVTSKAGDVVNASALIKDAPFVANRTTKYSGSLYSQGGENSVRLSTEWLTEYEGVY